MGGERGGSKNSSLFGFEFEWTVLSASAFISSCPTQVRSCPRMSVKERDAKELLSSLCRLLVYRDPRNGRYWVCNASSLQQRDYAWIYLDDIPGVKATCTVPPLQPGSSSDGTGEQGVRFVEFEGHLGGKDELWCIRIFATVEGCNKEISSLFRLLVYCDPRNGRNWVCNVSSLHQSDYAWMYLDDKPGVKDKSTLPPSQPGSSVDGTGHQGVGFVEVDGHFSAEDENWCIGIVAKVEGCNKEVRRGFKGRRIHDGIYVVDTQADAELVGLVAGIRIVRGLKPTATIIVATDFTAVLRSLMKVQRKTTRSRSKGPRESFIVLLRYLSYEIVRLLLQTDNGKLLFYHTSQVPFELTKGEKGDWVADTLSRDKKGALNTLVNFPPPADLSHLFEFKECKMVNEDTLLGSVTVILKNRETADKAMREIQPYCFLTGDGLPACKSNNCTGMDDDLIRAQ